MVRSKIEAQETRKDRRAVAGYDLVFTPVKSASLLWALGSAATRQAVEDAHHEAVADTLSWVRHLRPLHFANARDRQAITNLVLAQALHPERALRLTADGLESGLSFEESAPPTSRRSDGESVLHEHGATRYTTQDLLDAEQRLLHYAAQPTNYGLAPRTSARADGVLRVPSRRHPRRRPARPCPRLHHRPAPSRRRHRTRRREEDHRYEGAR